MTVIVDNLVYMGSLPKKDWTKNSCSLFEVPCYIFAQRFGRVEKKKETIREAFKNVLADFVR